MEAISEWNVGDYVRAQDGVGLFTGVITGCVLAGIIPIRVKILECEIITGEHFAGRHRWFDPEELTRLKPHEEVALKLKWGCE